MAAAGTESVQNMDATTLPKWRERRCQATRAVLALGLSLIWALHVPDFTASSNINSRRTQHSKAAPPRPTVKFTCWFETNEINPVEISGRAAFF